MHVPFMNLQAQYAGIREDINAAVAGVMESQFFRGGPVVEDFERALAKYCGTKHALGVSSGTDSVLLLIRALDPQPGDEVITTPFTFFATAGAIANAGAKPVFADIDPVTFNLDPKSAEAAITPRTRAILVVHLFGQCVDMDAFLALGKKYNLPIIEDNAQSLGATYKGRNAGAMGLAGSTSFYPSKNLGGAGEGGAITTNDDAIAEKVALLRHHGSPHTYEHVVIGTNSHLHALQAAVLGVKIKHLNKWNERRREIAKRYDEAFADLPGIVTPKVAEGNVSVWHQYVIRAANRAPVVEKLKSADIDYGIFYPKPLHKQTCFAHLVPEGLRLPHAERACEEVIALPIYPELTEAQQHAVINAVKG